MLNSLDLIFRLQTWTIYRRKGSYYITKEEKPKSFGRKYRTLRHACTAVARKLEEEWTHRAARMGR